MANTVFFSWQADRPTREGRNLVERALERAVGTIGDDTTIEEAVREVEVDRDTKGVPGSPPIVETIFRKIDRAAVFVPDLTFVGTRPDGRPTPNPNVLIEYGWALKSLGHGQIVPVMNTAFGEPTSDAMPFDMRHLRNPVQYNCPADASDETRKLVRDALANALESYIRDVLLSHEFQDKRSPPPSIPAFLGRQPKDGLGKFRSPDEPLGVSENFLVGTNEIKISDGPVVWFRLMPTKDPARTWQVTDLKKAATTQDGFLHPVLRGWREFNYLRAEDGFGIYAPLNASRTLTNAAVFAFKTGEVWSIDSYVLDAMARDGNNTIPSIEDDFRQSLEEYGDFLLRLGVNPPFRWLAGMENLKGRGLIDPTGRMAAFRGPIGRCISDVVVEEGLYHPANSPARSIEPFFVKLFDSCGRERPPIPED
jgi:hypothetical protein